MRRGVARPMWIVAGRDVVAVRRIAPMGGVDITPDGGIGPKSTSFFEHRAAGGAAVVTVSEVVVDPKTDASANYRLAENPLGLLSSFTYTADAIRRHGAVPNMELSHGGIYGSVWNEVSRNAVKYGPSGMKVPGEPEIIEFSKEQIKDVVAAYGRTAALAKRVGFEMVMIHGGHGWLINQFLSPSINHRTDEYGGIRRSRTAPGSSELPSSTTIHSKSPQLCRSRD